MLENEKNDLVQNIMGSMSPREFNTRLKFIALDKTLFEIEISSDGIQEAHESVLNVVRIAVNTASSVIVSAK